MRYRVACKRWRGVMAPRARATMASVSPQPLLNNTWGFGVLWEYSSLNGRLLAWRGCFHDGLGFSWYSWTNMQPLGSSISLPALRLELYSESFEKKILQHCDFCVALFFYEYLYFSLVNLKFSPCQSLLPNARLWTLYATRVHLRNWAGWHWRGWNNCHLNPHISGPIPNGFVDNCSNPLITTIPFIIYRWIFRP